MNTLQALVRDARRQLSGVADDPLLDAQVLLAHVLQRDRAWLYAHPEHRPEPADVTRYRELLERRVLGHPVSHLTGRCEFWSLSLQVSQDTLIPRPDTELLVETALGLDLPDGARVLDLGTGSGAIALALASERPAWRIVAVERSARALAVAQRNAGELSLPNVRLLQGDWFGALGDQPAFDLIVSNPPYVAHGDPHLAQGDVRFEPSTALLGGEDGLDHIRRIVRDAPRHLVHGGWLWLEHGHDQGHAVAGLLRSAGYRAVHGHSDLAGRDRVSGGRHAA